MSKVGYLLLLWAVATALSLGTSLLPVAGVWEPAGEPMPTVMALAFANGRLLAGGPHGLAESVDEGATWTPVPSLAGRSITAVVIGESRDFAAGPDGLWMKDGADWTASGDIPGDTVRQLAFAGGRLLAATDDGLLATATEEISGWERMWPAPDQEPAVVRAIETAGDRLLIGTDDGVVEIDGSTWEGRRLGPAAARILGMDSGGGWVHVAIGGPGGGLARAEIGSDEWEYGRIDSEYVTTVVLYPGNGSRVYAGLGGQATDRFIAGVARTEDGGLNWEPVGERLLNSFVPAIALDASRDVLYAGSLGGGVYRFRTPSPLHLAAESARPFLEVADMVFLGLAAVILIVRLWPRPVRP